MPIERDLLRFLSNPAAMQLWTALEEARVQAKAAGVEDKFDLLWNAELYRAKTMPGAALTPKEVLQITLAVA